MSKQTKAGETIFTRTGGGLVASIRPAIEGHKAMWIAGSVGEEPVPDAIFDDLSVHSVTIDEATYRKYYEIIANGTLWFLHHNLFDMARRPRIDRHWWEAWHSYCTVNEAFARRVASVAPEDAVVLVHDYHLPLLGSILRSERPDLSSIHFHHTPFADRNTISVIPQPALDVLLGGLAGYDACGFHSQRWADNFSLCCADALGHVPKTFVSAAAPDENELRKVANETATRHAGQQLENLTKGRKLIVRVDRIELSKNLLRGFYAFDELLREHPQWRGHVTFVAQLYPSRETMAEYLAYRNELEGLVDHINSEWSTPSGCRSK